MEKVHRGILNIQAIIFIVVVFFIFSTKASAGLVQAECVDVDSVWSAHPVDFDIQTSGNYQFVAYYDTARRMTVAVRSLGSTSWTYKKIPTTTGWDSHNYVALAVDDSGYVHVSGNMHNVTLIYYRSLKPYSIDSFTTPGMVGTEETSVTYPVFIKGKNHQFIFQYRDGGSGSGNTIWNGYGIVTKKWTRLTGSGLFNGGDSVNAYQSNAVLGPDSCYHIVWMWRDTPIANTNHHLSHMKSEDLLTWKTMAGASVALPVTLATSGVFADSVASGNGLINMDFGIGWDSQKRPVITYHKYAISGTDTTSQIFNTRWENNAWKIYQTSSWTGYKWNLDLQGSLAHEIAATQVEVDNAGRLMQYFVYRDYIKHQWILDETTLKPESDSVWQHPAAMNEFYTVKSTWADTPAMQINQKKQGEYYLRWETLPQNQDLARNKPYPPFSVLRVYRFTETSQISPVSSAHRVDNKFSARIIRRELMVSRSFGASDKPWAVSVYSSAGKRLLERKDISGESAAVNVGGLPCGVYHIQCRAGISSMVKTITLN